MKCVDAGVILDVLKKLQLEKLKTQAKSIKTQAKIPKKLKNLQLHLSLVGWKFSNTTIFASIALFNIYVWPINFNHKTDIKYLQTFAMIGTTYHPITVEAPIFPLNRAFIVFADFGWDVNWKEKL